MMIWHKIGPTITTEDSPNTFPLQTIQPIPSTQPTSMHVNTNLTSGPTSSHSGFHPSTQGEITQGTPQLYHPSSPWPPGANQFLRSSSLCNQKKSFNTTSTNPTNKKYPDAVTPTTSSASQPFFPSQTPNHLAPSDLLCRMVDIQFRLPPETRTKNIGVHMPPPSPQHLTTTHRPPNNKLYTQLGTPSKPVVYSGYPTQAHPSHWYQEPPGQNIPTMTQANKGQLPPGQVLTPVPRRMSISDSISKLINKKNIRT
jgi:hypothetical protein